MRGWDSFEREVVVGTGPAVADAVAQALFSWKIHRGAGLDVTGEMPSSGCRAILRWRFGPLRIPAPVEITGMLNSDCVRGFTYVALPGHPEEGEETFAVVLDRLQRVSFRITARSRPATWWARLGAPISRRVQRSITAGYISAAVAVGQESGRSSDSG